LGIGDWAQSPIPNPQSPIPNPQSPIPNKIYQRIKLKKIKINYLKYFKNNNFKINYNSKIFDIKI
jgi:hypothetical protein